MVRRMATAFAAVAMAIGCASLPDARERVDLAQESLTSACEAAFDHFEFTAQIGRPAEPDIVRNTARACSEGGHALVGAQKQLDAIEAGGGSAEDQQLEQIQAAVRVARQSALRALAAIAVETGEGE